MAYATSNFQPAGRVAFGVTFLSYVLRGETMSSRQMPGESSIENRSGKKLGKGPNGKVIVENGTGVALQNSGTVCFFTRRHTRIANAFPSTIDECVPSAK